MRPFHSSSDSLFAPLDMPPVHLSEVGIIQRELKWQSHFTNGGELGCIFLPESSGFLYFPFRSPVSHRNLNFRSAVILFFGIKRSKNLRSKTKASGRDHGVPRVPSGTVLQLLRLAVVELDVATLVLLRVEATRLK